MMHQRAPSMTGKRASSMIYQRASSMKGKRRGSPHLHRGSSMTHMRLDIAEAVGSALVLRLSYGEQDGEAVRARGLQQLVIGARLRGDA